MRSVLHRVSILALLIALLLGGIVLVPRAVYGAPKGNWLTWQPVGGCELPCWRGIVPEKTKFEEIKRILQHYPDLRLVDYILPNGQGIWLSEFMVLTTDGRFSGHIRWRNTSTTENQTVTQVAFGGIRGVTIAPLFERFGTPYRFNTDKSNSSVILYWERGITTIAYFTEGTIESGCGADFENLRAFLVFIEKEPQFGMTAKEWTGFDELKNAACTAPD